MMANLIVDFGKGLLDDELAQKAQLQLEDCEAKHFRFLRDYGINDAGDPARSIQQPGSSQGKEVAGPAEQMDTAKKFTRQIGAETDDWSGRLPHRLAISWEWKLAIAKARATQYIRGWVKAWP